MSPYQSQSDGIVATPGARCCAHCGANLVGLATKLFCGESCRKAAKRRRQSDAGMLPPSRTSEKAIAYKRRWRQRWREIRRIVTAEPPPPPPTNKKASLVCCANCGASFMPARSTQRFCRTGCRLKAKAARKRLNFTNRKRQAGRSRALFE